MSRKKVVLIYHHFEQEHLGKDVFLVPYYLGKSNGLNVDIVYPLTKTNRNLIETNKKLTRKYPNVKFVPLRVFGRLSYMLLVFFYLIRNKGYISCLIQFHISLNSIVFGNLFKYLNPRDKLYVKMDGMYWIEEVLLKARRNTLKFRLIKSFLNSLDLISIELLEGYKILVENNICDVSLKEKVLYIPNGFDEELLESLNLIERSFDEKENLIITVGRLGTYQKNTEMLLNALTEIELKDWKVFFIGPIDRSFEKSIECFYAKHPEKLASVVFKGSIYDKKALWEYYIRSKVFVLTSRFEGCALVLNEAKRFKNYIVSTKIGGFCEFVGDSGHGEEVIQNDSKALGGLLQSIINGDVNIDVYENFDTSCLSWKNVLKKIQL